MKRGSLISTAIVVTVAALLSLCGVATAQTAKVQGIITGRNGDTMTLQTADSSKLVVLLTDTTDVAQVQGVFKARRKEMSMAALIPGLEVKVEGSHNAQNQLVASSVRFKGNDLEDAQTIQAGLAPAEGAATAKPAGVASATSSAPAARGEDRRQ